MLLTGRRAWIQVVRGDLNLNGDILDEGDGAGVSEELELWFTGTGSAGCEFLLFDLP